MSAELQRWAATEQQFLKDDISWFKAGTKLLSPSGDNISGMKLEQLETRLEQLKKPLGGEF